MASAYRSVYLSVHHILVYRGVIMCLSACDVENKWTNVHQTDSVLASACVRTLENER